VTDNGEERTDIVVLVDEEGNEHDFALVDRFQVDLSEYAILVPVLYLEEEIGTDDIDLEDEAYIFRIDLDEGEEILVEVEDEIEWNQVAAIWEERVQSLEYEDDEEDLF
jgi:uncharacterized protein YrzB (UPF0473 family)